jgi:hypothetical protein
VFNDFKQLVKGLKTEFHSGRKNFAIDCIENIISAEVIFNNVLSAPVLKPATPRAATPNPFLTPSDFLTPLGNENSGVQRPPPQSLEMSTIPGLFPVHGATPPLMLSDLHSANATTEQHLLDGGNTTAPSRTINNVDLQLTIVDETAIANEATTPVVPASDCVRDTTSSHHLASQPNVHLQTLDAGHTFDLVFIDLPSLAWLRPAWLEHDLNGRLLYRLQPPHLADVLVDLELASQRYITSRNQKLNIARAIYTLILADDTSQSSNIAAWDRYSLTLPPINNLLTVNSETVPPRPPPGTVNNPLVLSSPSSVGNDSQAAFGSSFVVTPSGTIDLRTPISSATPQHGRPHIAALHAPVQRLFSQSPVQQQSSIANLIQAPSSTSPRRWPTSPSPALWRMERRRLRWPT